MIFFLASALSFVVILSGLLPLQPLPPWTKEMRVLSLLLCQEFLRFSIDWLKRSNQVAFTIFRAPFTASQKRNVSSAMEAVEKTSAEMPLLDLPEPMLEAILCKLPPASLCTVAARSLVEGHMKEKWGPLIDHAARRAWQSYSFSRRDPLAGGSGSRRRRWAGSLSFLRFLPCFRSQSHCRNPKPTSSLPTASVMSWYAALQSGRFWLPAQVYNRESGHAGFMLSCYDADLGYDHRTNTFCASNRGRSAMGPDKGPTCRCISQDLYVSECLSELRPGDHVEIQWRRSKEFPYGWWYGEVGHLESCIGDGHHCRCHSSGTLVVEFKQYLIDSRWRKTAINRKSHSEEGNETSGFYGGLRKLQEEEVATWRRMWPSEALQ
ncbi:unnamed protein product [Spirodela intermedia]|uniref:Uncharacterized protein n=1 Tax=Spirodela intermedia TaxID=51605 RepID=A0A7I8IVD8_SPIIN|nr:unnamed protein product [Spirodela intermedia]CAA6661956.1 unnamed protein product [Spirodela intermedia]